MEKVPALNVSHHMKFKKHAAGGRCWVNTQDYGTDGLRDRREPPPGWTLTGFPSSPEELLKPAIRNRKHQYFALREIGTSR